MSLEINRVDLNNQKSSSKNIKTVAFKTNPIPNDKVDISTKKQELSSGAKFGVAAVIAAAIVLGIEVFACKGKHLETLWNKISGKKVEPAKTYVENIEKIQEYFNKIFNKNLTKDEANEMALKYQEAFNEEKDLDFLTKLFNQLNKDYELPLKTAQSKTSVELGGETIYGEFSVFRGMKEDGTLKPGGMSFNTDKLTNNFDRKKLAQTFAHELKHAQQMKIGLGTNKHQFIENNARKNLHHKWYADALRARGGNEELAMNDYIQKIETTLLLPEFRTIPQIEQNTPLYQRGLAYIDNWKNYIRPQDNHDLYEAQLVEKEAFDVGDKFVEIFEMLKK